MKRKYRRIIKNVDSKHQAYYYSAICFCLLLVVCIVIEIIYLLPFEVVQKFLYLPRLILLILCISMLFAFMYCWSLQEKVSVISIPMMSSKAKKMSRKLKKLFNDKQITDVLKLSNSTRYGEEMPEIHVWIDDSLSEGFIAIENIANWERADREKFEQRVSGILSGKYQRFAILNSELTAGDSFILFYFEDTLTSQRLLIKSKESLHEMIHENKHSIRLSKDLVWYSDITPMMSIIARTRAGKSVLAGRYMASLMQLQGWIVEYNSVKYDRYVNEFNGQSKPMRIVECAEYWCTVMDKRLAEINNAGKDTYLEIENMQDVALFFDELGNFNASLESLDKVDKSLKITSRWTTAINRLSATGGAAGIHIIAISQFATKEGFLPSLARVNCSDAVIMLGGAADSADERKYLMSGFADMPKRSYGKGQGVARILGSGRKWEVPHFYEAPWFED
mgnify:CR=1 FL=1